MKIKSYIIPVILSMTLFSCDNNAKRNSNNEVYEQNGQSTAADNTYNDFETDRTEYGGRVQTRLDEMDTEIEEARERRKNERDAARIREYDADIEKRERERKTLRERWENAETKTEAEWEEFKREVDDLLKRDNDRKEATPGNNRAVD